MLSPIPCIRQAQSTKKNRVSSFKRSGNRTGTGAKLKAPAHCQRCFSDQNGIGWQNPPCTGKKNRTPIALERVERENNGEPGQLLFFYVPAAHCATAGDKESTAPTFRKQYGAAGSPQAAKGSRIAMNSSKVASPFIAGLRLVVGGLARASMTPACLRCCRPELQTRLPG